MTRSRFWIQRPGLEPNRRRRYRRDMLHVEDLMGILVLESELHRLYI